MACSACNKKKNQQQQTPIVTPINNLTPDGKVVPQNQNQPSEKFQRVRVLPQKRA